MAQQFAGLSLSHFTVDIDEASHVAVVTLSRPKKLNTMTPRFFDEIGAVFNGTVSLFISWVSLLAEVAVLCCSQFQAWQGACAAITRHATDYPHLHVPLACCITELSAMEEVNAVLLQSSGRMFTAGLDLRCVCLLHE